MQPAQRQKTGSRYVKLFERHYTRKNTCAAFTVIELLAVVAVLALLAATLATSVAGTRPKGYNWRCLNNLRQLSIAWRMYAGDNLGSLAPNRDGGNTGRSKADAAWAGGWLDYGSSTANTNVGLLVNHDKYPWGAYLGPYVKTPSVFKCPADKSMAGPFGRVKLPRVRSISMNNYVGTMSRTSSGSQARYSVSTQISQIKSPANVFVFLDEREDCINDCVFFNNPEARYDMVDYPASCHAGAGAFSFADAHAEIHKWKDPRTMPVLRPGLLLALNVIQSGNVDIDWMQQKAVGAVQ